MGTTSALSDRIRIMKKDTFPQNALALQVLINCGGGGDLVECMSTFTGMVSQMKPAKPMRSDMEI